MLLFSIVLYFLAFVILFRLARFFTTPLLKISGYYRYYSEFLFIMKIGKQKYDLHLGTSWDFFLNRLNNPRHVLIELAKGIKKLTEEIESGKLSPQAVFRGNTFYLKRESASKFGFSFRKLNFIEWFLFFMNYAELSLLSSIAHKKLHFVPVSNIYIIYATGEELIKNKSKFDRFLNRSREELIIERKVKRAI